MPPLPRAALPRAALPRAALLACLLASVSACARAPAPAPVPTQADGTLHRGETPEMRGMINDAAADLGIPPELIHRVVQRESGYNPAARNGPYFGLMQIMPETARTMGYRGPDAGLLDAETNLRWAGAYLRGAWIVADGDLDEAAGWYARGYYYEARNRCLLVETGLRDSEVRC